MRIPRSLPLRFVLARALALGIIVVPRPAPAQASDTNIAARMARVERNVIAIAASGADSGPAQTLPQRMAAMKVPGLSVAVFEGGRIVWAGGYGMRDVRDGSPVDTSTLFQAASISKPVSATVMFRLIEQGRLSLDEDVNEKLTSWKVPASQFTTVEKVTPRRLVSHMAGTTVSGFAGYAVGDPLPTLAQILDGLPPANSAPVRVTNTPGARESYSGGGVTVLQLMMQDITGKSFDVLANELVLAPVGMRRSTFVQPLPARLAPRAATAYDGNGTAIRGKYHVYPEQSAAGLWTTPSDLARFMLAIGRSYRGEQDGILRQATAREMLTPIPGGSGLGFGLSGAGDALRYRHTGGNAGFTCYAVAFVGSGRGVVIMSNSDNGTTVIRELGRAVSREFGWPALWMRE
ncbi:MAG: serine hydrolase domain-containing protein [bacterium]